MSNSTVPATIRAIFAAVKVALPSASVIVGPGATEDPGDVILIGVSDPDENAYADAVAGAQHWNQLGGLRRDEEFAVHCVAITSNGDGDALAAMDAVFALMGGVETALVNDPSLGKAVLYSMGITSFGLKFSVDTSGVAALIPFDVQCKARL